MKKLGILFLFTVFVNLCFADSELVDCYHDKLVSNKKVESLESISSKGNGVLIKGLVYNRVRMDSIYVKSNEENKDEVVLLISDLEKAFLKKNNDIRSINITATGNSLIAKGKVDVLGGTFNVVLEGVFEIKGNSIYYDIRKGKIGMLGVPQWVIKHFKEKINPFFEIDKLGIGLNLTKMVFEKDRILIK